jgi:surface antigen
MRLLLAVAFAAASTLAQAQNWVGLLKNTPAERFDEEDLGMFLDTARKALNEGADSQRMSWNNPKTMHRGEITVQRTFGWKTYVCKELLVYSEAGGRKENTTYNLCRVDNKWRLLSPQQAKSGK